jgi:uncharacterized protein
VIFVDSSFWIAVSFRRDADHEDATALIRKHASHSLVTSNHVYGETWTFVNRRYGHAAAVEVIDRIRRASRLRIEHLSSALEEEAWRWLHSRGEREYSFVDATSFALMRKLRIREALAFDGDFAAAGFTELRA